MHLLNTL